MQVYLAGHVPKGVEETRSYKNWRVSYGEIIQKYFETEILNPMVRNLDESDFLSIVGLDCYRIRSSAFIVVNAEEQVGPGTAQELIIAKYFTKPVITVLPRESKHRKSNLVVNGQTVEDWMHPFIFTFSDYILEDIGEFEKIKDQILIRPPKNINVIQDAINHVTRLKT